MIASMTIYSLKDNEHSFGFSPNVTYYFGKNNIHPLVRSGSSCLCVTGKPEEYYENVLTSDYSNKNRYIQRRADMLFRFNDHMAIDVTLNYSWHNRKYHNAVLVMMAPLNTETWFCMLALNYFLLQNKHTYEKINCISSLFVHTV
jgi:hypothetical protein